MTSHLVNLTQFGITTKDVKVIIEYLAINPELNTELIPKIVKFGNYLKKINQKSKEEKS